MGDHTLASIPPVPAPSLPSLTPRVLREAITSALERVSARELADECVRFGLPPHDPSAEEAPWRGKWRYVERRIRHWKLPELMALARDVTDVYDDRVLNHLLALHGAGRVSGEMKNLIFAANGPKPRIVLRDAINNDLEIIRNGEHHLVYDRPLPESGLSWRQLTAWWAGSDTLVGEEEREAAVALYRRLLESMDGNGAERLIFRHYCARYHTGGFDVPALLPQVYLHYDPYSRHEGGTLARQRIDFLLLLTRRRRVVIELDGIQHYADGKGRAVPRRYAEMAAADRALKLAGYEVYRFGGYELTDRPQAEAMLDRFFTSLLAGTKAPHAA